MTPTGRVGQRGGQDDARSGHEDQVAHAGVQPVPRALADRQFDVHPVDAPLLDQALVLEMLPEHDGHHAGDHEQNPDEDQRFGDGPPPAHRGEAYNSGAARWPLQSPLVPEMDAEAVQQVLDQVESPYTVDEVKDNGDVRLRLPVAHAHIRPGGTISGPALMAMADGAAWAALLAHRGPDMSPVSTSLHIDFLRRPDPDDLVADGVILRLGRTLAVIDVSILTAGAEKLVAKAQVTYAIPAAG